MSEALKQEVLSWVNSVRCGRMHMDPLDKLPQGVQGNSQHCVIARCWQVQDEKNLRDAYYHHKPMVRVGRVQVNSGASRVEFAWARYPEDPPRHDRLDIAHPQPVSAFIEMFDNDSFPELVDHAMTAMYGPKSQVMKVPQHLSGKPVVFTSPAITAEMVEKTKEQLMKFPPPPCFVPLADQMLQMLKTPEAPVAKPLEEEAETST